MDVKQVLVSLLPSQDDATTIVSNTTAWLWGLRHTSGTTLRVDEPIPDLHVAEVAIGSAMALAKTLLYLAIYMQLLPRSFDTKHLRVPATDATISSYASIVNSLVLSREEAVCSTDGIECLQLLGMIYFNEGAYRKAWLSFRRALDIAKLKGLRSIYVRSAGQPNSDELKAQRHLYISGIAADCYCSLLLGLEPVPGSDPFGSHRNNWCEELASAPDESFDQIFYPIVIRLAQRNFLDLRTDHRLTEEIDQDLDKLWDSMPSDWKRTPTLRSGRSLESAKDYNRLISHLSFFLVRIFVHIPFAFSSPGAAYSEKSREKCLEASRIILQRHLGLEREDQGQPRCKAVDVAAFLAAATVLLSEIDFHSRNGTEESRDSAYSFDASLLEQFMHSCLVFGSSCDREHIAKESNRVLSAILAASKRLESKDDDKGDGGLERDGSKEQNNATGGKDDVTNILGSTSVAKGERTGLEDVLASSFWKGIAGGSTAARVLDLAISLSQ